MKPLHESEVAFLSSIDRLWDEYEKLPILNLGFNTGKERPEMKKRFDEIRYMVAIRGMLRDGIKDDQNKLPETKKQIHA